VADEQYRPAILWQVFLWGYNSRPLCRVSQDLIPDPQKPPPAGPSPEVIQEIQDLLAAEYDKIPEDLAELLAAKRELKTLAWEDCNLSSYSVRGRSFSFRGPADILTAYNWVCKCIADIEALCGTPAPTGWACNNANLGRSRRCHSRGRR